ncbi:MAG: hypothetical protein ABFR62_12920 [Bacteroidota bacterium]
MTIKKILPSGYYILLSSIFIIITSCATVSYTPKVTLDVSPRTIHKNVQIEKLNDLTSGKDRKNPFTGFSVTNEKSLANDLDIVVTNSIVEDFSTNGVFDKVSRRTENADLIIRGDINTFYGKSRANLFAKISYFIGIGAIAVAAATAEDAYYWGAVPILVWYFGVPVRKNDAEIEITLNVYNNKDELLGTYKGMAYDKTSSNMYKNESLATPNLTNKTFSKAIQDIRDQIMGDYEKLSGE